MTSRVALCACVAALLLAAPFGECLHPRFRQKHPSKTEKPAQPQRTGPVSVCAAVCGGLCLGFGGLCAALWRFLCGIQRQCAVRRGFTAVCRRRHRRRRPHCSALAPHSPTHPKLGNSGCMFLPCVSCVVCVGVCVCEGTVVAQDDEPETQVRRRTVMNTCCSLCVCVV